MSLLREEMASLFYTMLDNEEAMTTPARREWIERQVDEHFPNTGIDSTTFRKVLTDAMAFVDAHRQESNQQASDAPAPADPQGVREWRCECNQVNAAWADRCGRCNTVKQARAHLEGGKS